MTVLDIVDIVRPIISTRLPRYLPRAPPRQLGDLRRSCRIAAPCRFSTDFDAHDGEFCRFFALVAFK